jgi:hypothetical protein
MYDFSSQNGGWNVKSLANISYIETLYFACTSYCKSRNFYYKISAFIVLKEKHEIEVKQTHWLIAWNRVFLDKPAVP